MQNLKLMRMFIQSLNALMRNFVIRNIQFLKIQRNSIEHLLQPIITYMVVYQI